MVTPGRSFSGGAQYRYGFNGQEKSTIIGEGLTTAEFWEYDSRIGRRFNLDPIVNPWEGGYVCFDDNPINLTDPFGALAGDPQTITTKAGDTYNDLSKKYNVGVDDLKKWNGYKDNAIPTGVALIIKLKSGDVAGGSATAGGNGYKLEESPTVKRITDAADKIHTIYEATQKIVQNIPGAVTAINYGIVTPAAGAANLATESNPDKQNWGDLFSIWIFELNKGVVTNSISYGPNAQTTKDLQGQEGVNDAREIAIARAKVGNTNPVNTSWTFGVKAAKDAIKNKNIVTAFLGSYGIQVISNVDTKTKAITLSFTVMNTSGWASGTRFMKSPGPGQPHAGIIQDKERGEGIFLGGNLKEIWNWTEKH